MTAYDSDLRPQKKRVREWFRFGRGADECEPDQLAALCTSLRVMCPGSRAERIASMAEFLLKYELDVNPFTLAIAYDYLTDSDPMLVRLIDQREDMGEPITLEWLEKVCRDSSRDPGLAMLTQLIDKLEKGIDALGETTSAARTATREYGSALEQEAEKLQVSQQPDVPISDLVNLIRTMVARTVEMEKELSRSERQTQALRRNLEDARRSANEDYLTGLPNRRAFEKMFALEHREARAALDPLVVAFCDIDMFKRINDAHGHETGDRVLKAVAERLSCISTDRCFVARHGGEEFVILFRGKSLEEATHLLDRAREELASRRMIDRKTKEPIGRVSFSAGIADVFSFPSARAALKAADDALYQAKEQGRNQITLAVA
jgi:diguanylate cyclase